jgi:hypothetical protein
MDKYCKCAGGVSFFLKKDPVGIEQFFVKFSGGLNSMRHRRVVLMVMAAS